MSGCIQSWEFSSPIPAIGSEEVNWYALQTRARHEKAVAERLQQQGVETFLPIMREEHRWSDRKKIVEVPLFGCYVFAKLQPENRQRMLVLTTNGVLQIVGVRGDGIPVPEEQIESVRTLVTQGVQWASHPFLKIGQRVRVRSGALNGIEGILVSRAGDDTLVVSVDVIQRSLAIHIEGYQVEAA